MLRLRTTTGLSLLVLVVGIVGTHQLSTWTSDWQGPTPRVAAVHTSSTAQRKHSPVGRRIASFASPARRRPTPADTSYVDADVVAAARATPAPMVAPELVPLSMPADTSRPWEELRGHLNGRVVLHVQVDGNGRVSAVSILESSGDPVLDEHAVRGVRGWRFAVPADQPDGISGNLPMRFSSHGDAIASVP